MNSSVLTLIEERLGKLSKSHRRIARYILDNSETAAYQTATRLGASAGVSESTVIRFANALGFEGYPELQAQLRLAIKRRLTSVQRIKLGDERFGDDVLGTVIANDIENLRSTLSTVSPSEFEAVIDSLVSAQRIYIIGVRSAASLASFLYFYFGVIFDNAMLVRAPSSEGVFEELLRVSERDAVIGISFPRYSKRTVDAMDFAKKRGAKVIALTDSVGSPVAENADHVLVAKNDMVSVVDSLVAPLSLINALVVGVCRRRKAETAAVYSELEEIWDEYNTFDKRL